MKHEKAVWLSENMEHIARRDRIFLNNPVVMQGMGLAPLVVAATTGRNALILSLAVIVMLAPTRVLAAVVSRISVYRFRALTYCLCSSLTYIAAYFAVRSVFGVEKLLQLGIFLPVLVVEPLIIKRYERPRGERVSTALKKGVRITCGYVLVLMLIGCLREILALGTLFEYELPHLSFPLLPLAALPTGGFILVGVMCAVWRGAVNAYKKHVNMEAKSGS